MMRSQWQSNLMVGIFVVSILAIFLYFIMNYTNELGMFEPTAYINTKFEQPQGLFEGAAVQLNNVKVGRIVRIRFSDKIDDTWIYVTMVVNKSDLPRIGTDAIAQISTVGLLGDNVINIKAGDPIKKGHIKANDFIESEEFGGLLGGIDLEGITTRLENILAKIDKGGIEEISTTLQNISEITQKIKDGEGTIGKLIADDSIVNQAEAAVNSLNVVIRQVNSTLSEVKKVVRRINEGPGSVHTLIYKDDVGEVMADLKSISKNLDAVGVQVKELVNEVSDQKVIEKVGKVTTNLAEASESLASIAKGIEEGDGTIGALLKDPTLYEDLKVILQGAKRSEALKYAIQHTIQQKQEAAERERRKNPPPVIPKPAPVPEPMPPGPQE